MLRSQVYSAMSPSREGVGGLSNLWAGVALDGEVVLLGSFWESSQRGLHHERQGWLAFSVGRRQICALRDKV